MASALADYSVPGQNPNVPVVDGGTYLVFNKFGAPGGFVTSAVSGSGLSVTNTTTPFHVFCCGTITRSASVVNGSWAVTTTGAGSNFDAGLANMNRTQGPGIFNNMDQQMAAYLGRVAARCR